MASSDENRHFRPALVVVDMQEDFCPPNGSLAIGGARDIVPLINQLVEYPFILKVATRDSHPATHISFAASHPPPNNKPFESLITIRNPNKPSQEKEIPLWPVHCVQGTKGAEIIPEINQARFDHFVDKGKDERLEMFSVFADVFGTSSPRAVSLDLAKLLKDNTISHVFTVGVAGEYCVKCTAADAAKEGFQVRIVEEAVRSADPSEQGWGKSKRELEAAGVRFVSMDSAEVTAVANAS